LKKCYLNRYFWTTIQKLILRNYKVLRNMRHIRNMSLKDQIDSARRIIDTENHKNPFRFFVDRIWWMCIMSWITCCKSNILSNVFTCSYCLVVCCRWSLADEDEPKISSSYIDAALFWVLPLIVTLTYLASVEGMIYFSELAVVPPLSPLNTLVKVTPSVDVAITKWYWRAKPFYHAISIAANILSCPQVGTDPWTNFIISPSCIKISVNRIWRRIS